MLNGIYKELLREIVLQAIHRRDIDALKFRADHEEHLSELDKIENSPYIEKRDNKYHVNLLALSIFKNKNSEIDSVLFLCEHLFNILRRIYKQTPGSSINLEQLTKEADLPEGQVRKGLFFLTKAHIFSGYSTDLLKSPQVSVTPSEDIIKFKTFGDLLKKLHQWANKSILRQNTLFKPDKYIPQYLQEMDQNDDRASLSIPKWYNNINPTIQSLMKEIYYGLQKEMKALPSMGFRTVIDVVCNELVGDIGGFECKLNELEKKGYITSKNNEIIKNILEIGHASAHRGYFPELNDLQIVLDIINHLLREIYVFDEESKKLKAKTPKRERNKK